MLLFEGGQGQSCFYLSLSLSRSALALEKRETTDLLNKCQKYGLFEYNSFSFLSKLATCQQVPLLLVCVSCSVMPHALWPLDCGPAGPSVHGILQARTLEWVAIPFFRGSSWPRDRTWVSCIVGRFFTIWATWEAPISPWGHS